MSFENFEEFDCPDMDADHGSRNPKTRSPHRDSEHGGNRTARGKAAEAKGTALTLHDKRKQKASHREYRAARHSMHGDDESEDYHN